MFINVFLFLAAYLALVCDTGLDRQFPINYIILAVFNVSVSWIASSLTLDNSWEEVACGSSFTVLIAVGVLWYTKKFDPDA